MRFEDLVERINPVLLLEKYFEYTFPTDKETMMYDFYTLGYLKDILDWDSPSHRELNPDLRDSVLDAVKILFPALRKELLTSVFYALCAEIRHAETNATRTVTRNLIDNSEFKDLYYTYRRYMLYHSSGEESQKDYQNIWGVEHPTSDVRNDPNEKYVSGEDDSTVLERNKSFKAMNYAMKKTGATHKDVARMCSLIFHKGSWSSSFGGHNWGNIADGWIMLFNADEITPSGSAPKPIDKEKAFNAANAAYKKKMERRKKKKELKDLKTTIDDLNAVDDENPVSESVDVDDDSIAKKHESKVPMAVAIDYVYDLQHNNDTVFNKLKAYGKDGRHYEWIGNALDFRANLISRFDMLHKASYPVKAMAPPILYNKLGHTWQSELKNTRANEVDVAKYDRVDVSDPKSQLKKGELIVLKTQPYNKTSLDKAYIVLKDYTGVNKLGREDRTVLILNDIGDPIKVNTRYVRLLVLKDEATIAKEAEERAREEAERKAKEEERKVQASTPEIEPDWGDEPEETDDPLSSKYFEIGDTVICVEPGSNIGLFTGEEYIIKGMEETPSYTSTRDIRLLELILVSNPEKHVSKSYAWRFKKKPTSKTVSPKIKEQPPEIQALKQGDKIDLDQYEISETHIEPNMPNIKGMKVIVKERSHNGKLHIGTVYEIEGYNQSLGKNYVDLKEDGQGMMGWNLYRFFQILGKKDSSYENKNVDLNVEDLKQGDVIDPSQYEISETPITVDTPNIKGMKVIVKTESFNGKLQPNTVYEIEGYYSDDYEKHYYVDLKENGKNMKGWKLSKFYQILSKKGSPTSTSPKPVSELKHEELIDFENDYEPDTSPVNVGDKVVAINPGGELKPNTVYVVKKITSDEYDTYYHFDEPYGGGWSKKRFKKIKDKESETPTEDSTIQPKEPKSFKVGDMVKCTYNKSFNNRKTIFALTVGKVYKVISVSPSGSFITITDDKGADVLYSAKRFELVEPEPELPPESTPESTPENIHPFKAGDKVKCIDNSSMGNLTLGKIYEVTDIESWADSLSRIKVIGDHGQKLLLFAKRFELVDQTVPEEQYNPKFRTGDTVKALETTAHKLPHVSVGKHYKVLKTLGTVVQGITIINDMDVSQTYFSKNFKKVRPSFKDAADIKI